MSNLGSTPQKLAAGLAGLVISVHGAPGLSYELRYDDYGNAQIVDDSTARLIKLRTHTGVVDHVEDPGWTGGYSARPKRSGKIKLVITGARRGSYPLKIRDEG